MKGIVVENIGRDSVILTEDGLFKKVKNNNYIVGQTVKVKNNNTLSKMTVGAASIAAAFVLCTGGAYAYFTPSDYVSMDVNPSIEYSLNMFDRVLEAKAVNDDGEKILANLDLKNKNIDDAMKETLGQLIKDGYINDDPNGEVVITTSNKDMKEAKALAAHLDEELQDFLDDQDGVNAKVDAEPVGLKRVQEARTLQLTPGKLNLLQKLAEAKGTTVGAILNQWSEESVIDIDRAIKDESKSLKEMNKDQLKQNGKPEQKDSIVDDEESTDNEYTSPVSIKPEAPANGQNEKKTNDNSNTGSSANNGQGNDDKVKPDMTKPEKDKNTTEE